MTCDARPMFSSISWTCAQALPANRSIGPSCANRAPRGAFRARWDEDESPSRFRFLIAHDLRANAFRVCRPKRSDAGVASYFQCDTEAADQAGHGKWFGEEAGGSGPHCPVSDAFVGKGGDENERGGVTSPSHIGEQVQTAHARHLYVGDDTRGLAQLLRVQELFGGCECVDDVRA